MARGRLAVLHELAAAKRNHDDGLWCGVEDLIADAAQQLATMKALAAELYALGQEQPA